MAASSTRKPYDAKARKASFLASKVVKSGYKDLKHIDEIITMLDQEGCKLGAGQTRACLPHFKEMTGLYNMKTDTGSIITNESLHLHHSRLSNSWIQTYKHYGSLTRYGHLIIAGDVETFQKWATSDSCMNETKGLPQGRLFIFVYGPKRRENPRYKNGYIVSIDCATDAGNPTHHNGMAWVLHRKGNYYVGNMRNGLYHGLGEYTYTDGAVYKGEYKDGKMHGKGTFRHANGALFVGHFKEDKMHGRGKYTYEPAQKQYKEYDGDFYEGVMHGQGRSLLKDGACYVGGYKNGSWTKGTYTYADGAKYEGEYKNGKMHGYGKYTYADGETYVGMYANGTMHGHGTYRYKNGKKFVGQFINGRTGKGTYN